MREPSNCINTKSLFIAESRHYHSGIVVLLCGIRRGMVLEVVAHRPFLVIWHREYVAEAASTGNDLLACTLGFEHTRAWVDLRCSDGGNKGACRGEFRVKPDTCTKDKVARRPHYDQLFDAYR
jgi:hypothetical protein